jgi:hypothetical protein
MPIKKPLISEELALVAVELEKSNQFLVDFYKVVDFANL